MSILDSYQEKIDARQATYRNALYKIMFNAALCLCYGVCFLYFEGKQNEMRAIIALIIGSVLLGLTVWAYYIPKVIILRLGIGFAALSFLVMPFLGSLLAIVWNAWIVFLFYKCSTIAPFLSETKNNNTDNDILDSNI